MKNAFRLIAIILTLVVRGASAEAQQFRSTFNQKSKIQNLKWAGFLAILVGLTTLILVTFHLAEAQQPAKLSIQ